MSVPTVSSTPHHVRHRFLGRVSQLDEGLRRGLQGVRVPMREIALSGGEPSLRVYDTSGPQGFDVKDGLPKLRAEWIRARDVEQTGRGALRAKASGARRVTQLAYARRGEITPEMRFIALREGLRRRVRRDRKWRADARSSRRTSITPSSSR